MTATAIHDDKIASRFWPKVDKSEECWEWTATKSGGYGMFLIRGRLHRAHRIAYELAVGPIPEGLVLHHECENQACVNPAHLTPLTRSEHNARHPEVHGWVTPQSHCKHGHEFTPENSYIRPNGTRRCRACHRANERRRHHARKANA